MFTLKYFKIWLFLVFLIPAVAWAQPTEPFPDQPPTSQQMQEIMKTLQELQAQQNLLNQQMQKILSSQPVAPSPAPAPTAAPQPLNTTGQLLQNLNQHSKHINIFVVNFVESVKHSPQFLGVLFSKLSDPQVRPKLEKNLVRLIAIILLAVFAAILTKWILLYPRRLLEQGRADHLIEKIIHNFCLFLLNLLSIAIFAAITYFALSMIPLDNDFSLAFLALINAYIIAQFIKALFILIFSPNNYSLRFFTIPHQTLNTIEVWVYRFTLIGVFGYFILQAAFVLGMPQIIYSGLLRLLGLLIALLLIMLIRDTQGMVTHLFKSGTKYHRKHLTWLWMTIAIIYIILLYGIWASQSNTTFAFVLRGTMLSLLALVLGIVTLRVLDMYLNRAFVLRAEIKAQYPQLEKRINRYLYLLNHILRFVVYMTIVLSILQAWGGYGLKIFMTPRGEYFLSKIFTIGGIVVISFLLWELFSYLMANYLNRRIKRDGGLEQSQRLHTVLSLLNKALLMTIVIIAFLMILATMEVNIAPLLAGAGILGLAIGFGSQKLVQDIITGIFMLLEGQISVGDVVNIGDKSGQVEAISVRTVRLRDMAGTVHILPYSAITSVSNLTKDFSYYLLEVNVAYRENVDEVMAVLQEISNGMLKDPPFNEWILEPIEVLGLDKFEDSAVLIKARIKTKPVMQWKVGREFNRRMKKEFDQRGIELPYPHTTIYFGQNKDGTAPPIHVKMSKKLNDS